MPNEDEKYYLINARIKPFKLDDVKEALDKMGIKDYTFYESKTDTSHTEIYRGTEYSVDFIPRLSLEIVVRGKKLKDDVITCIAINGSYPPQNKPREASVHIYAHELSDYVKDTDKSRIAPLG